MPFSEFHPGAALAGAQAGETYSSIMDRALETRNRIQMDRARLELDKRRTASEIASQDVQTQMHRIELGSMSANVKLNSAKRAAEMARIERDNTLMDEWNNGARDAFSKEIEEAGLTEDPFQLSAKSAVIQRKFARFSANPEIWKTVDEGVGGLSRQAEAINLGNTSALVNAGKIHPTMDAARAVSPYNKVVAHPMPTGQIGYVVTDLPEDYLDQMAYQKILSASSSDELRKIGADKEVAPMLTFPKSKASGVFEKQLQRLQEQETKKAVAETNAESKKVAQESKTTTMEKDLRQEVENIPAVREFRQVTSAFQRIEATATKPSAAGDISLLYNYMKMLDPRSTVREGEFATAASAGSVPDRIVGQYNRLTTGKRLSPEQRADFLNQARNLYESQAETVRPIVKLRAESAGRNGVNVTNVFTPEDLYLAGLGSDGKPFAQFGEPMKAEILKESGKTNLKEVPPQEFIRALNSRGVPREKMPAILKEIYGNQLSPAK